MIVEAWTDEDFFKDLTEGSWTERSNHAKQALADRGIFLSKAGVITEKDIRTAMTATIPRISSWCCPTSTESELFRRARRFSKRPNC